MTDHSLEEPAQARLSSIIEACHEAIIRETMDGVIVGWNPAAARIFGYAAEEILGRPMLTLVRPDRAEEERAILARIAHGENLQDFETVRIGKNEKPVSVSLTIIPAVNAQGAIVGASIIARDLTTQKLLEEKLRQAQRSEALGQLASGVAHDFNNLLTIVGANVELLLWSEQKLQPESKDCLQEIMDATGQAAILSRQLLAFSRQQATKPQVLDLNQLVPNFLKLLRRILGEDIQVQTEFSPGVLLINADPGLIEHVLMNLVVHGREAMPDGGTLLIRTSLETAESAGGPDEPRNGAGGYACLTVSDTGIGIAPDNISRTFEPFFTDHGAGAGLGTAFGIVKEHNGWIEIASKLGAGTTFRVFFPLAPQGGAKAGGKAAAGGKVRGGTETILVVEDEKVLRDLVRRVLENHGYAVLESSSGMAAQKIWAERGDRKIDLLLTDMVTPGGVTGLELAERLRKQDPSLKVILTSGYSSQLLGISQSAGRRLTVLKKPFSSSALAEAVRTCLDGT